MTRGRRVLHVAALPFPSVQGTQAALRGILRAQVAAGHEVHLLCYAHGEGSCDSGYTVHRIADWPRERSLRSGPSLRKPLLDLSLSLRLRSLHRRLEPDLLVAHHVEAACAAQLVGLTRHTFVAHTALGSELPGYLPAVPAALSSALGATVERWLVRRCDRAVGVSPLLSAALSAEAGRQVDVLPIPWERVDGNEGQEEACGVLGIDPGLRWLLYAGNLDHYQGWETMLDALRELTRTHPAARLLLATDSEPASMWERARGLGIADKIRLMPISGEDQRRRLHAAAELAVVPRKVPGGLPVKLLEAFSRGVPVVAMRRASAGLPVGDSCLLVEDDDVDSLVSGMRCVMNDPSGARERRDLAFDYLRRNHDPRCCAAALLR